MAAAQYSMYNLHFILYEVLDVLSLTKHSYFSAHDREGFNMVLATAEGIAQKTQRPFYKESDKLQPELTNGEVKVHPAVHDYYKAFCESGLMASTFDEQYGGQQLPKTIYAAADFIVGNAHNGFEMFTGLSCGAAKLLTTFASKELIEAHVPKILNGQWSATMCLTEPQAGSSLSDITTTASPVSDGVYKVKGQKIFISAGDHDITENIVHLVLARISGAPKGTKGISLFLVLKKKLKENGHLSENDVASTGIYHKMGQKSTPAMHLEFGANNNCIGYLIGEAGKGLNYMFQMMNSARLGVGLAGTYIATGAYYASLQYAKERPQGRRLNNKNIVDPQTEIINHPDVRRMLFFQKAITEGSLCLLLQCYKYVDLENICRQEEKQKYSDLLELLTPVAKTYGAEMGINSVSQGLQVLGGYGYTEDFVMEQLYRDVRIMSLYEGTTGIQALAVLGRQILTNKRRALKFWKEEVLASIEDANKLSALKQYSSRLKSELKGLLTTITHLNKIAETGNKELALSDATLFIELIGLVCIGWQWLRQATVAQRKIHRGTEVGIGLTFYQSKIETMKFFFHYEIPKTRGLIERLMDIETITIPKEKEFLI